jgi:hypothetical protein
MIAPISGPVGAYWTPQLTYGGLIWVAWGRMGPHGVRMGLAWGRMGLAWGRMGSHGVSMGPHGVSMGPHGPA